MKESGDIYLVNADCIDKIHEIFRQIKSAAGNEYLRDNRRVVIGLVETLVEQVVEKFTDKPRNFMDARRKINDVLPQLTDADDIRVLSSLKLMLQNSEALSINSYINAVPKLKKFIDLYFSDFCISLVSSRRHLSMVNSSTVKSVLEFYYASKR